MFISMFLLSIQIKTRYPFRLYNNIVNDTNNNINPTNSFTKEEVQGRQIPFVNPIVTNELPILRNKNRSGLDERFTMRYYEKESESLNQIDLSFHKMKALYFLQNNSNSIPEKLRLVEFLDSQKREIFLKSFTQGGLFHDWDSDIF